MAWHRFQGEATSYLLTDNRSGPFNSSLALPYPLWGFSVWITDRMKRKHNGNQETARLLGVLGIRGLVPSLAMDVCLPYLTRMGGMQTWTSCTNSQRNSPIHKWAETCRCQHRQRLPPLPLTGTRAPKPYSQPPALVCWKMILSTQPISVSCSPL